MMRKIQISDGQIDPNTVTHPCLLWVSHLNMKQVDVEVSTLINEVFFLQTRHKPLLPIEYTVSGLGL